MAAFCSPTELWETGYMVSFERTSDSLNEGLPIKMVRKEVSK